MNARVKNAIVALVKEVTANNVNQIFLQYNVSDSLAWITFKETDTEEDKVEKIARRILERYYDTLIGFKLQDDEWNKKYKDHYEMVLEGEAQKEFDESLRNYYDNKAAWCAKYGSN